MRAFLPWWIAKFAGVLPVRNAFSSWFSIAFSDFLNQSKEQIELVEIAWKQIWFVVLVLVDLTIFNVKVFPRIGSLGVQSRSNCCLSASNVRMYPGHGTSCNRPSIVVVSLQLVLTKYCTLCPHAVCGQSEHAVGGQPVVVYEQWNLTDSLVWRKA